MEKNFVVDFDLQKKDLLEKELQEKGFFLEKPTHTFFQAKKIGICCTLYTSGKLVVQGKNSKEFIEFFLEPEILQTFSCEQPYEEHIGSDESGKGDFFGPLCICALFAPKKEMPLLKEWQVTDSKKISDKKIHLLSKKIATSFPHHLIIIGPEKYNELIVKFQNLNTLLAWAHATAIDQLSKKTGCKKILIDKFAHERVLEKALLQKKLQLDVTQTVRAESDLVVAAASILARDAFVNQLHKLSTTLGIQLPKGASQKCIEIGKEIVTTKGRAMLSQIAKMHFQTADKILS